MRVCVTLLAIVLLIGPGWLSLHRSAWGQDAADPIERGAYLARAGLCIACHTDAKNKGTALAGGNPIKTPFGTIYSTNITPDRETGIGDWTDADFLRAMREGVGRQGQNLYPAFPYTAYTHMTDEDLLALKAYLFSIDPARQENKPPELGRPFNWRILLTAWKWMYLEPGPLEPDPQKSSQWNRGAYLVEGVVHCGQCHTPRDAAGGLDKGFYMAGAIEGPEGELAPNVTAHPETGLGDWSVEDMVYLLKEGIKPDGDNVQGLMDEIIVEGYSHMTDEDLTAVAEYIRALPPIHNLVE